MKQWFSRHWTTGNEGEWSLRDGKQMRRAQQFSQLLHRESFQAAAQGEGSRWSLGGLSELKRWSWEFREIEVTGFYRTEYWRGESCKERKFQSSINQTAEYQTERSYEETIQGRKKNRPKGLEGTILRGHTELKIVPIPTNQTEKVIIYRALGRIHRKVLPQ